MGWGAVLWIVLLTTIVVIIVDGIIRTFKGK